MKAELESIQNEIRKIKGLPVEPESASRGIKIEHDYEKYSEEALEECNVQQTIPTRDSEDIKKYIREQILLSEMRVIQRFDQLEQRINRLLERQLQPQTEEEVVIEEEHLAEYIEPDAETSMEESNEIDCRIFPIADEVTFDWFFDKLRNEEYRNALVARRWNLTRNVSTKSFNTSVKDFIRMHFDYSVVVLYSVSGFGAHGIRKKKLDSNSLNLFVFDCFNRSFPDVHSFQECSKAIVQFWGRAPDTLSKINERAIKRENINYGGSLKVYKM